MIEELTIEDVQEDNYTVEELREAANLIHESDAEVTVTELPTRTKVGVRSDGFSIDDAIPTGVYLGATAEFIRLVHQDASLEEAMSAYNEDWPAEEMNVELAYDILPDFIKEEISRDEFTNISQ